VSNGEKAQVQDSACAVCHNKFEQDDPRYVWDWDIYVCVPCLDKEKKNKKKPEMSHTMILAGLVKRVLPVAAE